MDTALMEVYFKNLTVKDDRPPCRCEFVYKWLDDHLPYFPPLPPMPEPKMITRLCAYTFGPAQIHQFYSPPVKVMYPARDIHLPFVVPAPHRISPLRPFYH